MEGAGEGEGPEQVITLLQNNFFIKKHAQMDLECHQHIICALYKTNIGFT